MENKKENKKQKLNRELLKSILNANCPVKKVEDLIKKGADINIEVDRKMSESIMDKLTFNRVMFPDRWEGYTPIQIAAYLGRLEKFKLLLENGADTKHVIKSPHNSDKTMLPDKTLLDSVISTSNSVHIIKEKFTPFKNQPLTIKSFNELNHPSQLKELFELKNSAKLKELYNSSGLSEKEIFSNLKELFESKNLSKLKELPKLKDFSRLKDFSYLKDPSYSKNLSGATQERLRNIVGALAIVIFYSSSILSLAAIDAWDFIFDKSKPNFDEKAYLKIAKILIKDGAEVMPRHLSRTASSKNFNLLRFLCKNIKDINGIYNRNGTPLHIVATGRNFEAARILVEHGADPNFKNPNGFSSIDSARISGAKEMEKFLKELVQEKNTSLRKKIINPNLAFSSKSKNLAMLHQNM